MAAVTMGQRDARAVCVLRFINPRKEPELALASFFPPSGVAFFLTRFFR